MTEADRNDARAKAKVRPVEGISHWCQGLGNTCAQVVKNSTVFCEAGHENDIVTSVASGADASLEASLSSLGIEEIVLRGRAGEVVLDVQQSAGKNPLSQPPKTEENPPVLVPVESVSVEDPPPYTAWTTPAAPGTLLLDSIGHCTCGWSEKHTSPYGALNSAEFHQRREHGYDSVSVISVSSTPAEHTVPPLTSTMTLYARAHHLDPADLMAVHNVEPEWVAPVAPTRTAV